jgi:hypothetical protein
MAPLQALSPTGLFVAMTCSSPVWLAGSNDHFYPPVALCNLPPVLRSLIAEMDWKEQRE